MSELPKAADKTNPSITRDHFLGCCKEAAIRIDVGEDRALSELYEQYMNNKGEMKLTKLLACMGLPP